MFKIVAGIICFIYAYVKLKPESSDVTGWIALAVGVLFTGFGLAQPKKEEPYGSHPDGGADYTNDTGGYSGSDYSGGDGGGGGGE